MIMRINRGVAAERIQDGWDGEHIGNTIRFNQPPGFRHIKPLTGQQDRNGATRHLR